MLPTLYQGSRGPAAASTTQVTQSSHSGAGRISTDTPRCLGAGDVVAGQPRASSPPTDPLSGLIQTFGGFAVGYLMRSIGGMLFGHLGDPLGRKRALQGSRTSRSRPPEVRGPRAPNRPVVRGKRHRVGTGSGHDQAVSRITVKRRRERIEGEHHLDAEWHHGNHPGIGRSREPIREGPGQIGCRAERSAQHLEILVAQHRLARLCSQAPTQRAQLLPGLQAAGFDG